MSKTGVKGLRHYARIPFHADVLLHVRDQTFTVQLVDIALKGALVQTERATQVALQDPCSLVLPLADDGEGLTMSGRIVHLNQRQIGMECLDIDIVSLTRLRRLIELNTGDSDLMDRELSHLFS